MQSSKRKLVTLFSALTEAQRDRINGVAGENGFTAVFCGSKDEAKKEIQDAEVFLGMDADLVTPHSSGTWTLSFTVETIVDMFVKDFDNYCAGRALERLVDKKEGY